MRERGEGRRDEAYICIKYVALLLLNSRYSRRFGLMHVHANDWKGDGGRKRNDWNVSCKLWFRIHILNRNYYGFMNFTCNRNDSINKNNCNRFWLVLCYPWEKHIASPSTPPPPPLPHCWLSYQWHLDADIHIQLHVDNFIVFNLQFLLLPLLLLLLLFWCDNRCRPSKFSILK